MFDADVFDHVEEQWNSLLITRDEMMSLSVSLSKLSFTMLI